ncbi:MFS transporter [Microcella alkaliphila]|uniref:MFS transporter n=1 Tax=Microcella alkaliphila TaxID=279828 RepID=A0A4V2FLZ0_9MICO|nr:MFS transporter [Microcella alkaliphila]RZT55949.1 MFS transporter [Microcella alkaliphila]
MTDNERGKAPTTSPSASTAAPRDLAAPSDPRIARRARWASLVGTSLESYDFYIYAYFAAFFVGPLFFDPLGGFGGTLAAFLSIALAFVIRPVGAIIFGHIGDRLGRRMTLIVTVTLMGVATGLIGVLPTYEQAGWFGAAILVVLRLLQGISLGGEWGGAVLIATEHESRAKRAFAAAMPQLGSPIGSILSAGAFIWLTLALTNDEITEWAWRLPFLTAIPLLLVSLYLRVTVTETPVFQAVATTNKRVRVPLAELLKRQPVTILVAVGVALLGIGSYSLMNTYTINYGVTQLGFEYYQLLIATTIGGLLQLVTIPLFGAWATRIGSGQVIAWGALGTLLVAFPIYFFLQFANFGVLVAMMVIGGILPTMSWAALGGIFTELFDERYRYSALGFAYSLAAVVSGFVPALTLTIGELSGNAWWHPGVVLAAMSAITLVSALIAIRMRVDRDEDDPAASRIPAAAESTP